MTTEKPTYDEETLGQLLKRIRIERGYDIPKMVEETRISTSNINAMEEDDYGSLPADAFCRGFYGIYAKALALDPDEVVARYRQERGINSKKGSGIPHNPPAHKAAKQVGNMATPSGVSPLSTIGYILLLIIILVAGLCWYFNINPATFLSEKLRSFQNEAPQPVDQSQQPQPQENESTSSDADTPAPVQSKNIDKLALLFDQKAFSL